MIASRRIASTASRSLRPFYFANFMRMDEFTSARRIFNRPEWIDYSNVKDDVDSHLRLRLDWKSSALIDAASL